MRLASGKPARMEQVGWKSTVMKQASGDPTRMKEALTGILQDRRTI
jgi:hypothetical protein